MINIQNSILLSLISRKNYNSYSELESETKLFQNGTTVTVLGVNSPDDGGAGIFRFDSTLSNLNKTNGLYIKQNNITTGLWVRLFDGINIDARWLGIFSDSTGENNGTDNSPKLQSFINEYENFNLIFPFVKKDTFYKFLSPVIINNSKQFKIIGDGGILKYFSSESESALFTIINSNIDSDSYKYKHFIDLKVYAYRNNSHVIKLDSNVDVGEFTCHKFLVDNCHFLSLDNASYCIWMKTSYTIAPKIKNSWFQGNGAIYWAPCGIGSTPSHSTSNMIIENIRCQSSIGGSKDGSIYLSGCKNCNISSIITEGNYDNTLLPGNSYGITIANPGPYFTNISNWWNEWWGIRPDSTYDLKLISNVDGPDYGLYINIINGPVLNKVYIKNSVAVKGGAVHIYGSTMKASTLSGWILDDETTQVTLEDIEMDCNIPQRRFLVKGNVVSSGSTYETILNSSNSGRLLHNYCGGTINQIGMPLNAEITSNGTRYVQWVPGFGACIAIRKNTNGLSLSTGTTPQTKLFSVLEDGDRVGFRAMFYFPHKSWQSDIDESQFAVFVFGASNYGCRVAVGSNNNWFNLQGSTKYIFNDGPILNIAPYSSWNNEDIPEWLIVSAYSVSLNKIPDIDKEICGVYECYEDPKYPGIPIGTSLKGSKVYKLGDNIISHYMCTSSGTNRIINITGNTTTNSFTIDNISQILDIIPGDHLVINNINCYVVSVNTKNNSAVLSEKQIISKENSQIINLDPTWITIKHNI